MVDMIGKRSNDERAYINVRESIEAVSLRTPSIHSRFVSEVLIFTFQGRIFFGSLIVIIAFFIFAIVFWWRRRVEQDSKFPTILLLMLSKAYFFS